MQPRPASPQVTTIQGVCCYLQSNLSPSLDGLHGVHFLIMGAVPMSSSGILD